MIDLSRETEVLARRLAAARSVTIDAVVRRLWKPAPWPPKQGGNRWDNPIPSPPKRSETAVRASTGQCAISP
jgi:hypothetical protein